jgi:hypothetical protein
MEARSVLARSSLPLTRHPSRTPGFLSLRQLSGRRNCGDVTHRILGEIVAQFQVLDNPENV